MCIRDSACADAVNAQPVIANSKLGDCSEEERACQHHDHFHSIFPETNWESAIEHGVKIGIGNKEDVYKRQNLYGRNRDIYQSMCPCHVSVII